MGRERETEQVLTIDHVGHRGDGVANVDGRTVYAPFTLAGETVRAAVKEDRAQVLEVVQPSEDRRLPVCRHFGTCGGCGLQHMKDDAYRAWKAGLVENALRARGIDAPVAPVTTIAPHSRRRAVLTAIRAAGGIVLGYHQRLTHHVVAIEECPVLAPRIAGSLESLRKIAATACPRKGQLKLTVLATNSGLDVALQGIRKLDNALRLDLTQAAIAADIARLSSNGDVVIETRPPALTIGGASVVPPPGGFAQAALEAETALIDAVVTAIPKARKVADLFSGIGTFSLPVARHAAVHAVEGDNAAAEALRGAVRHASGLKPVTVETRDLFRRPLMEAELNAFDAVIFDPPRAGAKAQAEMIASSRVATVVAVSCNPATLARDLRILIEGGYEICSVQPVDQFLFTHHIESVVVLKRR